MLRGADRVEQLPAVYLQQRVRRGGVPEGRRRLYLLQHDGNYERHADFALCGDNGIGPGDFVWHRVTYSNSCNPDFILPWCYAD